MSGRKQINGSLDITNAYIRDTLTVSGGIYDNEEYSYRAFTYDGSEISMLTGSITIFAAGGQAFCNIDGSDVYKIILSGNMLMNAYAFIGGSTTADNITQLFESLGETNQQLTGKLFNDTDELISVALVSDFSANDNHAYMSILPYKYNDNEKDIDMYLDNHIQWSWSIINLSANESYEV